MCHPSPRRSAGGPTSPRVYGGAEPTTAPAAGEAVRELGIDDPHPLIAVDVGHRAPSCETAFFSDSDWQRLRLELWFANHTMASGRPSAGAWDAIQHGLNEMLLSPAVKRRAGIELRSQAADEDENAAVSLVGKYRQVLKSV